MRASCPWPHDRSPTLKQAFGALLLLWNGFGACAHLPLVLHPDRTCCWPNMMLKSG
jgi:hypothetical protein